MPVDIVRLTPEQAITAASSLRAIYRAAFAAAPYFEHDSDADAFAADTLPQHASYPGFRGVTADAAAAPRATPSTTVLGFAYGYTSMPGQWWHDIMAYAMGDEMRRRWLLDAFEVVELAVIPTAQRQGIGGRLYDALLADLPHTTAVLSTALVETPALQLYRNRGWVPLLDRFAYPSGAQAIVLGLDLPVRSAAAPAPPA